MIETKNTIINLDDKAKVAALVDLIVAGIPEELRMEVLKRLSEMYATKGSVKGL